MSKKVISILLSAAMLVAMLCVGVGAVTASAADTATYYFLAPDEYFTTNDSVGYYFWGSSEESAAWPGAEMTAAPEIGENVYKCEAPADAINIIFNAFVDAGTPADPELAANAHQTKDINLEGYYEGENAIYDELGMELDNFYGMIFVLNNNDKAINDFSGAATTGGAWFSVDPSAANYYKNFEEYYGTYNFDDTTTDSDVVVSTDSDVVDTELHAGDKITLKLSMKDVKHLGSFVGEFNFNADLLGHTVGDYTMPSDIPGNKTLILNDEQIAADGMVGKFKIGNIYDPVAGTEYYAGSEAASVVEINCTVLADCNKDDLQLAYYTKEIATVNSSSNDDYDPNAGTYIMFFQNKENDPAIAANDVYTEFVVDVECNHEVNTDTDTATDTDTSSDVASDTDTSSDVASDTDTSSDVVVSDTDKTTDSDKASDKDTDSDKKSTNDTASKTSSKTSTTSKATTTTTTSTVQTAGTFAVVSLVVILMAAAAVVLYTRKKTEE